MYTLVDPNWIKEDATGKLFDKDSDIYSDYVDYCDGVDPVISLENPTLYESIEGSYKGKRAYFCKIKASGTAKRVQYLTANKNRRRGLLINQLCKAVIDYVSGKHDKSDMTLADVDGFMVAHGAVLIPLSQSRHTAAKVLIDAIVPDQYISQDDLDNIEDIYNAYLIEIANA